MKESHVCFVLFYVHIAENCHSTAEKHYLHSFVAEIETDREHVIHGRAIFVTRYAFGRIPKYGVIFVVPVHHVPGALQGETLKN